MTRVELKKIKGKKGLDAEVQLEEVNREASFISVASDGPQLCLPLRDTSSLKLYNTRKLKRINEKGQVNELPVESAFPSTKWSEQCTLYTLGASMR